MPRHDDQRGRASLQPQTVSDSSNFIINPGASRLKGSSSIAATATATATADLSEGMPKL